MTSDVVLAAVVTGVLGIVAAISAAIVTARTKDRMVAGRRSEYAQDEFRVRIVDPVPDAEVRTQNVPVRGTFAYVPPGHEIWVAVYGVYPRQGKRVRHYWPQQPAAALTSTANGRTWAAEIAYINGQRDGHTKQFVVFVVGPNGQALFHYYVYNGIKTGSWTGITQLTNDIYECDTRQLVFRTT